MSPFNTWNRTHIYRGKDPASRQRRGRSDLQAGEERQQRIHPGPSGKQRFVDVDVQQQRRLADVLHDGRVMLEAKRQSGGKKEKSEPFRTDP